MRTLALWFPDWPVQAAVISGLATHMQPVIISQQHSVTVCNTHARARGVKRGMRLRAAQALVPEAAIIAGDAEREGRTFADITTSLDEIAASVEVLRPGLVVMNAHAIARFYGSEAKATEKALAASARQGVDCVAGIADDIPTATIAARYGKTVEQGCSQEFLAPHPLSLLTIEPSLDCDAHTVSTFMSMGVQTFGDLAALDRTAVHTRFGHMGMRCHRIACAAEKRLIAPDSPVSDMALEYRPEEAINRVDTAAFVARFLAANIIDTLRMHGYECVRLKITATIGHTQLERIWRTREALTEQAIADRMRWQLAGWITAHAPEGEDDDALGITEIIIDPVECRVPAPRTLLGNEADEYQSQRVISRVQSTLGVDRVVQPTLIGGIGVTERVIFTPYGEDPVNIDQQSWRDAIPAPLPARVLHPAARCQLLDGAGMPVELDKDQMLSAPPVTMRWGKKVFSLHYWAGPWPFLGQWWAQEASGARLQVVGEDMHNNPQAWLLLWVAGVWRVEATYD
ncbi:DNA polymerase Y family protein [Corynebacterium sp. ES2794-CONJ1]|uniref:Y-family DNA polymerase n=1 Tax=unclassified Corynebacterium TaxID=2624378 RepID=UPI002169CB3D|nr:MULTISPECIES: DNA polymerase Y family protein [unclassified Corynebacterium]MCS4489554.1 DNA polymerase Y family protein [Corynebacterium sp. ES2775-CONJ]MCS4491435.1 DNA polymerase Y family protein [Corynebacterium sp. ES2715-CONJ3]MCS4531464.1 DNA polymerase Y family protein [Corynebacterium sp. ES2730-CONJ]MCU9518852.1 DNA polymerase Y family protein [Corynebacterium sp. ES2794-CONJ1]